MSCRRGSGFTLVEMLVVLVIAGIIFLTALPGYRHVRIKSQRVMGKAVLYDVMSRQTQYMINYGRHATNLRRLGLPADYYIDSQGRLSDPGQAIYAIALRFEEDRFHGVSAVPQNQQRADTACLTLTLHADGGRSVSGSLSELPRRCW